MARTTAGRELTERHRRDQNGLAAAIVKAILSIFDDAFDLDRIDESAVTFARKAAPIVMKGRRRSREMSGAYLSQFQYIEAPDIEGEPDIGRDTYEPEQAIAELIQTVIASSKAMIKKGYDYNDTRDATRRAVGGKATKIVADGGRSAIESDVRTGGQGRGPIGYARVVDADPCPFCAMLASRGVYYMGQEAPGRMLYRSDSFTASNARFEGDGRFKVHDGCECTLEPVYYDGTGTLQLPGNGNQLAKEWAAVAAGRKDPVGTWRRWRDSGTLPEDYNGPLEEVGTKRPAPRRAFGQGSKSRPAKTDTRERAPRELNDDLVREYLAIYRERRTAIIDELDELKARGQGDTDTTVVALNDELRRLDKRISRYSDHLR